MAERVVNCPFPAYPASPCVLADNVGCIPVGPGGGVPNPQKAGCRFGAPRPSCYNPGMRPSLLDPLFAPAGSLPGIGPKNAKLVDRLLGKPEGARIVDVLFHLPHATLDRRARPKIRDAVPGTIV